jgi:uncharacterized protein YdiU (UPF0061 family)
MVIPQLNLDTMENLLTLLIRSEERSFDDISASLQSFQQVVSTLQRNIYLARQIGTKMERERIGYWKFISF